MVPEQTDGPTPKRKIDFEDPLGQEPGAGQEASSESKAPETDPVDQFFANSRELWRRIRSEAQGFTERTKEDLKNQRNRLVDQAFTSIERSLEECSDLGELIDSFAAEELRSVALGAGEKSDTYMRMHELKADSVTRKAREIAGQLAFDANAVELFAPAMFKEARSSGNPFSELNNKLRELGEQVLTSAKEYSVESYPGSYRERIVAASAVVKDKIKACRAVYAAKGPAPTDPTT